MCPAWHAHLWLLHRRRIPHSGTEPAGLMLDSPEVKNLNTVYYLMSGAWENWDRRLAVGQPAVDPHFLCPRITVVGSVYVLYRTHGLL